MNYPVPIKISLFDFFTNGMFDIIKVGQTKEFILNNFPKPEEIWDDKTYKSSIWSYSTLEFHFNEDELFLIWCDGIPYLENLEEVIFDKWILDKEKTATLGDVLKHINNLQLDYKVTHGNEYSTILAIKQSGVRLHFEDIEEGEVTPIHNRPLIAFGLSLSDLEKPW